MRRMPNRTRVTSNGNKRALPKLQKLQKLQKPQEHEEATTGTRVIAFRLAEDDCALLEQETTRVKITPGEWLRETVRRALRSPEEQAEEDCLNYCAHRGVSIEGLLLRARARGGR